MAKPKHAPGPWTIGAIESGRVAVDAADGSAVTGWLEPADAQLIAAAPDLAAVVLKLAKARATKRNPVNSSGAWLPLAEEAMEMAVAALKKAGLR